MPDFELEDKYSNNYGLIAGVDEVGRGCLAGPVVACAVILTSKQVPNGLNDSKTLSPVARKGIYDDLLALKPVYSLAYVGVKRIEEVNILNATMEAMREAVSNLSKRPDFLLIDGNRYIYDDIPYKTVIKGDARSYSIAAASVIAKVERDKYMTELGAIHPQYGFARNKGYGTKEHIAAIHKYGALPVHRDRFLRKITARKASSYELFAVSVGKTDS